MMALSDTPNWSKLYSGEWEQFISNPALIGRDIELIEYGICYRGPIDRIELNGSYLTFFTLWTALFNPTTESWQILGSASSWGGELEGVSVAQEQGTISISVTFIGHLTIYPPNNHIRPES